MALRGESIGTAYVRILADGSGFADDARRQLESNNEVMRQAGEDHSRAYSDGFREELKKEGPQNRSMQELSRSLARGAGRFDAVGELFGDHLLDGLRDQLENRFDDVGLVIFDNLKDALEKGDIDFHGLTRRLENIRPDVARATQDITREQNRIWAEGFAEADQMARIAARTRVATEKDMHKRLQALRVGAAAEEQRYNGAMLENFRKLKTGIENYGKGLVQTRTARRNFRTDLVDLVEAMPNAIRGTASFEAETRKLMGVLTPAGTRLDRLREGYERVGTTFGKAFGKGSRNDFLNFVGSAVGGLTQILQPLLRVAGGFQQFVQVFGEARDQGAGVFESLGKSISSLGGPIIQLGVLLAAISAVISLLPALGAAVSGVTGLVLALAGSLGFALVGALGAVAGALVPFAAAIGVAALAMSGLGKKNSGLKELKKDFDDLKKTAAEGVFGKDGAGLANLQPILKGITPIVETVSKALGGLLTQLGEFGKTKGFSDLMSSISKEIGPMVTALGTIGGKFAVGIGQAFVALGPIINEFLGWLDQIADKFVAFGKGGKKSGLAQWFEDAWASAKIIGGLIGNVIDLIGELFSAGKGTGDSLFQGIADKVKEIVEWLSKPEGQKALADWFAFAQRLGTELGKVVVKVVEFIDALDTPESREMLIYLVQGFGRLIGIFTALAPFAVKVGQAIMGIGNAALAVFAWFQQLPAMISGAVAAIGAWASSTWALVSSTVAGWAAAVGGFFTTTIPGWLASLGAAWTTFWTSLTTWVSNAFTALPGILANVGFMILQGFVGVLVFFATFPQRIVGYFLDLGPKIIAAIGDISARFGTWLSTLPAKAKGAVDSILKWFSGLGAKIIKGAGNLASQFASWVQSLPGKAKSAATSIINGFGNLASKIISKAGSIATAFGNWIKSLPGKAKDIAGKVVDAFKSLASKAIKAAGDLPGKIADWGKGVASKAGDVADKIVGAFKGLASRIVKSIGTVVPNWALPKALRKAAGGIISSPVVSWVGEEGPEAIIPLNRNLSRVDPAVRALSAIAQGLPIPAGSAIPPGLNQGSAQGATFNIYTPTEDPRAVAAEVFARFTAASYV